MSFPRDFLLFLSHSACFSSGSTSMMSGQSPFNRWRAPSQSRFANVTDQTKQYGSFPKAVPRFTQQLPSDRRSTHRQTDLRPFTDSSRPLHLPKGKPCARPTRQFHDSQVRQQTEPPIRTARPAERTSFTHDPPRFEPSSIIKPIPRRATGFDTQMGTLYHDPLSAAKGPAPSTQSRDTQPHVAYRPNDQHIDMGQGRISSLGGSRVDPTYEAERIRIVEGLLPSSSHRAGEEGGDQQGEQWDREKAARQDCRARQG